MLYPFETVKIEAPLFFIVLGIEKGNMEQTNHDNEKRWTYESLKQEIECIERYIRGRDKRWAHDDTKRDAYREWQRTQVSGAELERLIVNWTRSDKARIKYRVDARKKSEDRLDALIKIFIETVGPWPPPPVPGSPKPKPCKCAKEEAENAKRRKKEDERMAKARFKEDTLKARKRKAHDDRIAKKRFEQDARDSFERAKQDEGIAADRAREDKERNERHKEHVPGTGC